MLEIDHAIMLVTDPAATAGRLTERGGLQAAPGGRHRGHGTGNWVVPLATTYLELLYVLDADEAADSPLGRWTTEQTRNGDRLGALCLRTDDIDGVARRVGTTVTTMRRDRPSGAPLAWRLTGLERAMSDDPVPFFIQWDSDERDHPSRTPVDHRATPDDVTWIEFGGDAGRLAAWLGDHTLPIRSVDGRPGPRRLSIATSDGPLIIGATGVL